MANNRDRVSTVYVITGNPDTVNENVSATLLTVPYAPGELGQDYPWRQKWYQIVQLDPNGATTSLAGGVQANQVAYWLDKAKYIVTNNSNAVSAPSANQPNFVAGRFGNAVSPGNVCHIQQGGLANFATTGTFTPGDPVAPVPASGTVAPGTAGQPSIGQATGAASGGVVQVYMNVQSAL